jgi:hypothetical protein
MTIGADVAPPTGRAEFLAGWRLTHDAGFLAGPLSIAVAATFFPLAVAAFTVAGLSATGAVMLGKYVPEYTRAKFVLNREKTVGSGTDR